MVSWDIMFFETKFPHSETTFWHHYFNHNPYTFLWTRSSTYDPTNTCTTQYDLDGTIACHKARLVAEGLSQVKCLNYKETFAHVAQLTTIYVLLA